jgi:hypothetical protein
MVSRFLLLLTFLFAIVASASADGGMAPSIRSVQGKIVFVKVPPGFTSVTLQQRSGRNTRPWKILATKPTSTTGGIVGIVLRNAAPRRGLFVFGERAKPVTNTARERITSFPADPALEFSNGVTGSGGAMPGVVALSRAAGDSVAMGNSISSSPARGVVESDIWRIDGDRLYFFNQLRGLQVFDIADPDAPSLLGQLREPNRGEQIYLLDATHVALLTRASYYFSLANRPFSLAKNSSAAYSAGSGAIVIANVAEGKPEEVARVSYPGYLVESRLVGTALYLVSQVYDGAANGLQVTSYDLSDPANPVLTDTLELGSYGGVIAATDRFLFVMRYSNNWRRSLIDVIDISEPNGALVKCGEIPAAGQVQDKFKVNLKGDILTVVSEVPRNWSGDWNAPANQPRTMVETFSLSQPAAPVKLGSLELGVGETVHATRFTEDRLYVVTFLTIDPLWVVDLADPSHPTLLGELHVPGFSTYIEPLGDRLVSIGHVDSRTAVSLFDVSDPTDPVLLSQLPLGEGYSYSEANWDEKAFSVIPEHNLILVPYSGYDSASGWASRIQLIDLGREALTGRGIVNRGFAARRTAVVEDRILAISPGNLVTVNFEDRDHPVVTSDVEIAWRVDRIFLSGTYTVQIGGSVDWSRTSPPNITIATAADPDSTVNLFELGNVPVTGATVRNNKLYLAQQDSNNWLPVYQPGTAAVSAPPRSTNPLILSVFDLSALPEVTLIGRTEARVDPGYGYGAGQLEPAWPNADTLVWVREQWSSWWWYDTLPVATLASPGLAAARADNVTTPPMLRTVALAPSGSLDLANVNLQPSDTTTSPPNAASPGALANDAIVGAPGAAVAATSIRMIAPWYRTSTGHEMVVFDVRDTSTPKFTTTVDARIGQTGDWSAPVALEGKLYLSYMAYDDTVTPGEGGKSRRYRHFLKSIDFTDTAKPTVSEEVNIPGRLLAVTHRGETLLTVGCGFDSKGDPTSNRVFHTSQFDGSAATLADQLLTSSAYDPYVLDGNTLLIGSWSYGESKAERIRAWQISDDNTFTLAGQVRSSAFSSLKALNGLLVGYGNGLPEIFDVSDAANPRNLEADTRELTNSDLTNADGGAGLGIWQAQGSSGVGVVRLPK